eukprot:4247075-Pyramimonas_sp.AAC.1
MPSCKLQPTTRPDPAPAWPSPPYPESRWQAGHECRPSPEGPLGREETRQDAEETGRGTSSAPPW